MQVTTLGYASPWDLLRRWPQEKPICFIGGTSGLAILALEFYEVAYSVFCEKNIYAANGATTKELPFAGGYMGVLSYDDYDTASHQERAAPSRVMRVERALVFQQEQKKLYLVETRSAESADIPISPVYSLSAGEYAALFSSSDASHAAPGFTLVPHTSDAAYLASCKRAIGEIRAGRYYQINVLRYFSLAEPYQRRQMVERLARYSGPYGAWFDLPELSLASFSPERFVTFKRAGDGHLCAKTYPIKGTRPRSPDRERDIFLRKELEGSKKDHAELNMIVDLMRNDFNTISVRGSVQVKNSGEVLSFPEVHHLRACISSRFRPELTLGEALKYLCPAGSISGCPKREVMQGIAEAEGRRRGYFMGNVFYFDDYGRFDSSVLIRTIVARGSQPMEYAAGSGIVIKSIPELELSEINDKCRVVRKEG